MSVKNNLRDIRFTFKMDKWEKQHSQPSLEWAVTAKLKWTVWRCGHLFGLAHAAIPILRL